jgi:hypothetical protein
MYHGSYVNLTIAERCQAALQAVLQLYAPIADSARLRAEWVPVMSIAQIIRLCACAKSDCLLLGSYSSAEPRR